MMNSIGGDLEIFGVSGAPNEIALRALMKRTGYPIVQETGRGQRVYGPPPYWTELPPSKGCEVFVGKVPRDCFEDELVPVFETVGRIYELRMMMDFQGTNRGFCFVTFMDPSEAKKAVKELNNYEIRRGRFLGVCLSVDNCRLFVGGLPRGKQQPEILEAMRGLVPGVVDVIVYADVREKTKNRGFAFVEFDSHRSAAMARRKLVNKGIRLWDQLIAVDWAEPEPEIDDDVMSKVKILYFRNMMLTTTEQSIEQLCNKTLEKQNCVERVKKLRDYAFVHFREREDALKAMELLNGTTLDGSVIQVFLAKPAEKKSPTKDDNQLTQAVTMASISYTAGGAIIASPFQAITTTREGSGRNPLVMGTKDVTRGRTRGAGGIGRIYSRSPSKKIPTEILEEVCLTNGWGYPEYQHFYIQKVEDNQEVQQWVNRVSIPAFLNMPFMPSTLSKTKEEAKQVAASHTLKTLGLADCGGATNILSSPPTILPAIQPGMYSTQPFMQPAIGGPQLVLTNGQFVDFQPDMSAVNATAAVPVLAGSPPGYFLPGNKQSISIPGPYANIFGYSV